jgi:hypothetical protein
MKQTKSKKPKNKKHWDMPASGRALAGQVQNHEFKPQTTKKVEVGVEAEAGGCYLSSCHLLADSTWWVEIV